MPRFYALWHDACQMLRRGLPLLLTLVAAPLLGAPAASSDTPSADALIVLTSVGYMTGAADGCKVVPEESNAVASGMALAINGGKYGDIAEAHALLNKARQQGVADAASGKADCAKVAKMVRDFLNDDGE